MHLCPPKNIKRSEKEGKGRLHRKPSKAVYNNSCWTAEVTFLSQLLDRFHPELVFLVLLSEDDVSSFLLKSFNIV